MDIEHFYTLKRNGLLNESLLQELHSQKEITDEELALVNAYEPSEEFTRLHLSMENGEQETAADIELIEASINLGLEFNLLTEEEHDDLMDQFEGTFGLRLVEHDGLQMVAMAVPFWNGKETMRADGCIYTFGGQWLNIFTGETKWD